MRVKHFFSVLTLLSTLSPNLWGQSGLDYFKNLQQVRRDIFQKTSPSVMRVQVMHRSLPAFLLTKLERCTSECEFKPWQRGEISNEEATEWQGWCDSFMDFTDAKFRAVLQSETDTVMWDVSLKSTFEDWLTTTRQQTHGQSVGSLDRFSEKLGAHVEAISEDLKKQGAISPKPMVRDQSTGVLVRDGIVVTTQNIAKGIGPQDWIRVWSDDQVASSSGEVIGVDPDTNLAVIRLATPSELSTPPIKMSPGIDPCVGDFVFFLSHPFNQRLSMQTGEITSLYNQLPFFHCTAFHSTSFPTSPGTLGGPIVNLEGELVGINTVYMGQGNMSEITYALPVGVVMACVDQIIEKGHVERGRLGVYLSEFYCPVGHHARVSVQEVLPGTVAAAVGLEKGDIIDAVNGAKVSCRTELISELYQSPPDRVVNLDIDRAGELLKVQLKLAPYSPPQN